MDKVKILRTPYQGGFRDFQISANANNIDTNDGNNVQTALDNLNDRLDNDINNRFIQNEESIQNLGKDKTAIFDSIDRLEAQIEDIDALFPSEAITAIIENASAAQVQAIQYAGNQQLNNITNSGLGQVANIQNKGASQLSAFEAAIEDVGQAQINSFNIDAAAAAQNQIASINNAGTARLAQIEQAIQSKAEQALADIPDDYTELGQQVNNLKNTIGNKSSLNTDIKTNLVSAINEVNGHFLDGIDTAVENWLEDHPEATTTVQDGSLTETKLSNALKLKTIKDYVTPEMFGAVGDGVSDDTEALNEAFSYKNVLLISHYFVTSSINVTSDNIVSYNAKISGNIAGFILNVNKLTYTSLLSNAYNANKGDTILNNINVNNGTSICILSSDLFNQARPYYVKGEFNTVLSSGLEHPIYDDYTDADLYTVTFGTFNIDGKLTIINTNTGNTSGSIYICGIANSEIKGLVTQSYGAYSFSIKCCYKMCIDGTFTETADTLIGLNYGVIISNSQDIKIDCIATGSRHGLAVGGGSDLLNIVNRNIIISGIYFGKSITGCDLHGNTEFCNITGNVHNGLSIGGKNHIIHSVNCISPTTYGIDFVDIIAGDFVITNSVFGSSQSPQTLYNIYMHTNNIENDKYTFSISNCKFIGGNYISAPVGLSGLSTDKLSLLLSNNSYEGIDLTCVVNNVGSWDVTVIANNNEFGENYYYKNCKVKQSQFYRGTESITFTNSQASEVKTITIPVPVSYPNIILIPKSKPAVLRVYNIYLFDILSRDKFRVVAYTSDGVAATGTIEFDYVLSYI